MVFLDTDMEGNIYYSYRPKVEAKGPPWPSRLIKLRPDGSVLGEIDITLPPAYGGDIGFGRCVAPNGDVYRAYLDGRRQIYWIERYPTEWFTTPLERE